MTGASLPGAHGVAERFLPRGDILRRDLRPIAGARGAVLGLRPVRAVMGGSAPSRLILGLHGGGTGQAHIVALNRIALQGTFAQTTVLITSGPWVSVFPTSASAVKRCGLGAVIAAAYQFTRDYDAANELAHNALRPHSGISTLVHVNDERGHAAVLALFDEVIAAVAQ